MELNLLSTEAALLLSTNVGWDSGFHCPTKALRWGCVEAAVFYSTVRNTLRRHPLAFPPQKRKNRLWLIWHLEKQGNVLTCILLQATCAQPVFCCFSVACSLGKSNTASHALSLNWRQIRKQKGSFAFSYARPRCYVFEWDSNIQRNQI